MAYQFHNDRIRYDHIPQTISERVPATVQALLDKSAYAIDVHTHYFDMKCINKGYFLLRALKDLVGLKSADVLKTHYTENEAYEQTNEYQENWEDKLKAELEYLKIVPSAEHATKGIGELWAMRSLLGMKKMKEVYRFYIDNFSLAKHFPALEKTDVISTVLMMDLECGWEIMGRIKKTIYKQIDEIKSMTEDLPVLPFLACDPRRFELDDKNEELIELFNHAFTEGKPFFGIKIYPALGYLPSDYRLWPIYEVCEKFNIPVVSHHGGNVISTERISNLVVYDGQEKKTLSAKNRKDIADKLNDPVHWSKVLSAFNNLRLNIAHFGGDGAWRNLGVNNGDGDLVTSQNRRQTILDFMNKYPNVYADFSFNFEDDQLALNLKSLLVQDQKIRERTLFGTDFWVVNPCGDLHEMQGNFLQMLQDGYPALNLPAKICMENPHRFLFS